MIYDPRMGAFFLLTGVTFVAFASGFSVCLLGLDHVKECVAVANQWVDKFHEAGSYVVDWGIAVVKEVFRKH
jgi:hypothetical protein